jgi:hypothetical protein
MICALRNSTASNIMSKNVQKVKNSLKFKAEEKEGLLSVRIGVKKYTIPHKVRLLSDGQFLFLSFTGSTELYQVGKKQIEVMAKEADATEAFNTLNPGRKKKGSRKASGRTAPLSPELEAALKAIPVGYRLVHTAEGSVKLVRTRNRKKKSG